MRKLSLIGGTSSSLLGRLEVLRSFVFVWTPWRLNLVNALLAPVPYHFVGPMRATLYRWAGLKGIDSTVFFEGPLYLRARPHAYRRLRIGPRSEVFGPCRIEAGADVTIGADVGVCIGVSIYTSSHDLGPARRRMGPLTSRAVRIEDGAWIGAESIITAGVTVGRGAVVAPASLVLRDVPPNAMVQGSPARVVKFLSESGGEDASTAVEGGSPGRDRPPVNGTGASKSRRVNSGS